MSVPRHTAASHRRRLLGRVRVISLGIAGGAAVAALGIGTAFAHAIPGHSAPASAPAAPVTAPVRPVSSSPAARARTAPARRRHAGRAGLAAPTQAPQAPAPQTSAPQVVSGGS